MEKREIKLEDKKSLLSLENRKKLVLTGIIEVISFNEDQIALNTNLGILNIKGKNLKMNKLDVQNGDVVIIGTINSCVYINNEPKKKKHNLISKMFK
ncbi:sporulation protein YabP [Clostridium luticellarii]|jgi:sporulation protein YabP|uniref:Spore protein YabP n=1 Tax=Clostridium luticellarii TaxID=1691940 RepID=A0A2T0BP20_9CLOT|nr:sporulation protein YabP [Clostridium luticellarii]MCI1944591.1 sporulation protein YabP [Clostridium luticellarii]MCI1968090.1 sporulation protein YabP [Clostridium luticellarii]MCI1994797.1 sporulation protein YabP [Clostridium luticellarii]MCI2039029.1 sporulation protein YabP [Clostridium luticellarii]PRR85595.1 Spore protein YabP [Clostridium luticellarii]